MIPGAIARRHAAGDPYWPNVVLLAFNENGAAGSTTFVDQSGAAHTLTCNANNQWSSTQAPPGMSTSMSNNGSSGSITTPDSEDWNFTGDFTTEGFVYWNSIATRALLNHSSANLSWGLYLYGGNLTVQLSSNGSTWDIKSVFPFGTPSATTWYHWSICRSGSTYYCHHGGTYGASFTDATALYNGTGLLVFGKHPYVGSDYLNGYMGPTRITKGVARYATTGNIDVPSLPFPNF